MKTPALIKALLLLGLSSIAANNCYATFSITDYCASIEQNMPAGNPAIAATHPVYWEWENGAYTVSVWEISDNGSLLLWEERISAAGELMTVQHHNDASENGSIMMTLGLDGSALIDALADYNTWVNVALAVFSTTNEDIFQYKIAEGLSNGHVVVIKWSDGSTEIRRPSGVSEIGFMITRNGQVYYVDQSLSAVSTTLLKFGPN